MGHFWQRGADGPTAEKADSRGEGKICWCIDIAFAGRTEEVGHLFLPPSYLTVTGVA